VLVRQLISTNDSFALVSINEEFEQFIRPINQEIAGMRMKIARGIDESTGIVHYALVNLAETHLSRMCVQYSPEQQKVLRCVLEMVVQSSNGTFIFKDLFRTLLDNETRFTRVQLQAFLSNLTDQRFLCLVGANYSLDVRGCIELEPYFAQHYTNKMESCNACRVLCLRGVHCNSCSIKLHQPCLTRSLQDLDGKCPSCSQTWVARKPVSANTSPTADQSQVESQANSDESF
jgi:hypothetical protein